MLFPGCQVLPFISKWESSSPERCRDSPKATQPGHYPPSPIRDVPEMPVSPKGWHCVLTDSEESWVKNPHYPENQTVCFICLEGCAHLFPSGAKQPGPYNPAMQTVLGPLPLPACPAHSAHPAPASDSPSAKLFLNNNAVSLCVQLPINATFPYI